MNKYKNPTTINQYKHDSHEVPYRLPYFLNMSKNILSLTLLSLTLHQMVEISCQLVEPVKTHCKNAETRLDQCSQKVRRQTSWLINGTLD